jgi:hypothetical protein
MSSLGNFFNKVSKSIECVCRLEREEDLELSEIVSEVKILILDSLFERECSWGITGREGGSTRQFELQ